MEKIDINLIKDTDLSIVVELLSKLRSHSLETYVHSLDVAEKSLALAHSFGIAGDDLKKLYTASLLHDIGKLYVDNNLLHKQNATESETELIKLGHIVGTKSILCEYFDADFVKLAAHHHERLNCSGYPEHLNAKKLDILDRILQVADVTSALQMNRSYKAAFSPEQVVEILNNLVRRGELDKTCVNEIEKIYFSSSTNQSQFGS